MEIALGYDNEVRRIPVSLNASRVDVPAARGLPAPQFVFTNAEDYGYFLALLEPDQMHQAHVNLIRHGRLICHAQRPKHELCPLRDRCRAGRMVHMAVRYQHLREPRTGKHRLECFEIAAALERPLEELRDGKFERAGLQ